MQRPRQLGLVEYRRSPLRGLKFGRRHLTLEGHHRAPFFAGMLKPLPKLAVGVRRVCRKMAVRGSPWPDKRSGRWAVISPCASVRAWILQCLKPLPAKGGYFTSNCPNSPGLCCHRSPTVSFAHQKSLRRVSRDLTLSTGSHTSKFRPTRETIFLTVVAYISLNFIPGLNDDRTRAPAEPNPKNQLIVIGPLYIAPPETGSALAREGIIALVVDVGDLSEVL